MIVTARYSVHSVFVVSDPDFRLQFATVFQLFGGATQSSGDRGDFTAFTGEVSFFTPDKG